LEKPKKEQMRIYTDPRQAVQETERDLWEIGINVHPATMQDKDVKDDPDYLTKEVRHYGFHVQSWRHNEVGENEVLEYVYKDPKAAEDVQLYIGAEFWDRVSGTARNPGTAWQYRKDVWNEFMHGGKFAYTYSERMAPQILRIMQELRDRPETRQAIINIHSNIAASELFDETKTHHLVMPGADIRNMGGKSRIPCSLYYQIMIREEKVDLVYAMRSCDFLVHFPVDIMLAMRLQTWFADRLEKGVGLFTYFTGSLHSYAKDMKKRGIF
jgi:thymidylate synthase